MGQAARQQDKARQAQEQSPGVETLRKSHEQQREPSPIPLGVIRIAESTYVAINRLAIWEMSETYGPPAPRKQLCLLN